MPLVPGFPATCSSSSVSFFFFFFPCDAPHMTKRTCKLDWLNWDEYVAMQELRRLMG